MGENRSVPALPLLIMPPPLLTLLLVVMPPLVGPRPEPAPDLPPAAAAADGRELECACLPAGPPAASTDAAAAVD